MCLGADYLIASLLAREDRPGRRKALLVCSTLQNLAVLTAFKYWEFIVHNVGRVSPDLALWLPRMTQDGRPLELPPEISFYVFESLSFVIDVASLAAVAVVYKLRSRGWKLPPPRIDRLDAPEPAHDDSFPDPLLLPDYLTRLSPRWLPTGTSALPPFRADAAGRRMKKGSFGFDPASDILFAVPRLTWRETA